jgi:hypothetical protein
MNNIVLPSWRPKKRNVRYQECPEGVPDWVYTEAVAAKRFYNEDWEFWVWQTAQEHNCRQKPRMRVFADYNERSTVSLSSMAIKLVGGSRTISIWAIFSVK